MPSTRWLHGKQFCREQSRAALSVWEKLPWCFFLFFAVHSLDYVMQLSLASQKIPFGGGCRKSPPWRSLLQTLQRVKQDDPFDPGFIQRHFACQGRAQTVRCHQQVEGISPVLCAADLNTSPRYVADLKQGVVLCKLCYAGCLAIVPQHLILDLCLA